MNGNNVVPINDYYYEGDKELTIEYHNKSTGYSEKNISHPKDGKYIFKTITNDKTEQIIISEDDLIEFLDEIGFALAFVKKGSRKGSKRKSRKSRK